MKFGRAVQEITAELSDPLQAKLMQTDVGVALLKIVRVIHDPEARRVEYLSVTMTPERSRRLMTSRDRRSTL